MTLRRTLIDERCHALAEAEQADHIGRPQALELLLADLLGAHLQADLPVLSPDRSNLPLRVPPHLSWDCQVVVVYPRP